MQSTSRLRGKNEYFLLLFSILGVSKFITLFLLFRASYLWWKIWFSTNIFSRFVRNITIQSIFHCLDMFFLLPQGKYSRILETTEIEEDNCSPYLVLRISSNKQTEKQSVTPLRLSESPNQKQCQPGMFRDRLKAEILLLSKIDFLRIKLWQASY